MTDHDYRKTLQEIAPHLLPQMYDHIQQMLKQSTPIGNQLQAQLKQREHTETAIFLIAQLGAAEFVSALVPLYKKTRKFSIRHQILYAWWRLEVAHKDKLLQHMKKARISPYSQPQLLPFSLTPFLKIAQNAQQSLEKRLMAIEALAWHGNTGLLPVLLRLLHDTEPKIRWISLYTIGKLGDASLTDQIEFLVSDTAQTDPFGTVGKQAQRVLDVWHSPST